MPKKDITEEEYQKILKKIQIINEKKAYLKATNNHKLSYNDIMNIVINLQRENSLLLEKFQLERKKYLSNFLGIYIAKEKLELLLDRWINDYVFSSKMNDIVLKYQAEEALFRKDPNFIAFKETTLKIILKWEANKKLLDYINSILEEEKKLLFQKNHYERKKRKNSSYKKNSNI